MSGEKRFRTGLFGYKRQDVYEFIEKLSKDFEQQFKEKDDELSALRNQNQDLRKQLEELKNKLDTIESGRTHIANAIIKAEEQAKNIIEEAVREGEEKKKELQRQINEQKNKLKMLKNELFELRTEAIDTIRRYEKQLIELVGEEDMDSVQEVAVTQQDVL